MKTICNRESLSAAFQLASGVVPSRSPKPMILNVKLVAGPQETVLLATDLEVGVRCRVDGIQVQEPGEVILSNARMNAILRESTDTELQIRGDESKVQIKGMRSSFSLPTEDPREFPAVEQFDHENYHAVKSGQLQRMIRRTIFATDAETTRYALNGIMVEFEGNKVSLVATDGRRLAVMRGAATMTGKHLTSDFTSVLPTKAMTLVERNLRDEEEDVQIALEPNKALIRTPRAVISTRLVEGRFPRYQDVFPSASNVKIPLNVKDLLQAVRQAAIVTNEESRGVDWLISEGKLTLSARAAETGQSEVELPISYTGDNVQITFDPRFVTDMLRVLPDDGVVWVELNDSSSAAVFKVEDGYSYVVMPLMRER
jgi:DNA polymerase-3 subunit beta